MIGLQVRSVVVWLVAHILCGGVLVSAAAAQTGEATSEEIIAAADARVRTFLESLAGKDATVEQAYDALLKGGPLAGKKQSIEALVARSGELESRYGTFRAAERIEAKRIGADVLLFKYLYKCDNFPVVWYFTFYRDQRSATGIAATTTRGWSVIAVRFDTEIELLGL